MRPDIKSYKRLIRLAIQSFFDFHAMGSMYLEGWLKSAAWTT